MTKRTVITIEKRQVQFIRGRRINAQGWCDQCGREVQLVTCDAAAELAGVSARAIFREVEAGRIHFTETQNGLLLVCANSLD